VGNSEDTYFNTYTAGRQGSRSTTEKFYPEWVPLNDDKIGIMLILAIDTALDACAAGVLDTEAGRLIAMESQAMKRGHAEALMPLIGRVMKDSGVAFASLDRIAVTTGPGSFTGLRVGLSAAR